jgi:hypothetical protein
LCACQTHTHTHTHTHRQRRAGVCVCARHPHTGVHAPHRPQEAHWASYDGVAAAAAAVLCTANVWRSSTAADSYSTPELVRITRCVCVCVCVAGCGGTALCWCCCWCWRRALGAAARPSLWLLPLLPLSAARQRGRRSTSCFSRWVPVWYPPPPPGCAPDAACARRCAASCALGGKQPRRPRCCSTVGCCVWCALVQDTKRVRCHVWRGRRECPLTHPHTPPHRYTPPHTHTRTQARTHTHPSTHTHTHAGSTRPPMPAWWCAARSWRGCCAPHRTCTGPAGARSRSFASSGCGAACFRV